MNQQVVKTFPENIERFGFGKNWLEYIKKNLSPEKVEISRNHLLGFLGEKDISGKTFLDIGCGSGLHSIAALQAGADQIYSFDYDPKSVEASKFVKEKIAYSNKNWTIERGDVLDDSYMEALPKFDIVYSWGVLHHTGDVWHAIRNAASRVKKGGLFYIALYSADVEMERPPEFWLEMKKKYVSSGWLKRQYYDWWYVWTFYMHKKISNYPAFLKRARDYKEIRGMNIITDVRDWLGGWPMEYVYDAHAIDFCEKLGFRLEKIVTGQANTEFLFVREK